MKRKLLAAFLFGLMITFSFAYTRSWTESTPTDNTVANQIDNYNRYLRVDVGERLETYIGGFNASDSNEGFYQVLFIEKASFSTPAANKYVIGGKLVDGKCELVGMDEDGDEIQISSAGKLSTESTVVAKTEAGNGGATNTLTAAELNGHKTITNTGAGAEALIVLPAGVAGMKVNVVITVAQYMRFTADGSEKFRFQTETSAGGGYIRSNTIGDTLTAVFDGVDTWVLTIMFAGLSVDE